MQPFARIAALLLALVPACSAEPAEPDGEPVEIVDQAAWVFSSEPELDPFPAHRPASVRCSADATSLEVDGVLEIDSNLCNYFILTQPLRVDVEAGDSVDVEFWHFELTHFEPAAAHVAVALGGDIVWELEVPIPHEAYSYEARWIADRDYSAGTQVTIHLHNHGKNNYRFLPLTSQH